MIPEWGEITIADLASACGGVLVRGHAHTPVHGVSTDTRSLGAGDLFIALSGPNFDGHSFAERALSAGASGVVVSSGRASSIGGAGPLVAVDDTLAALRRLARWWRARHHHVLVAAITGSVGKTTTKEMAALVIGSQGPTLKTEGNFNNLIGVPLTLLRIRREHLYAVVEMGMNRPGEISALTETAMPDIGLITNVGMAHLEGLGSVRGVARAKWELAEGLRPGAALLINGDDDELVRRAAETGTDVVTFGIGPGNEFRATEVVDLGAEGVRFRVARGEESLMVKLSCPGVHQVVNALGALALGVGAGVPLDTAAAALEKFSLLKGRFMVKRFPGGLTLVDDTYNANPVSLKAALTSVSGLVNRNGRLLVGLGAMGELGAGAAEAHLEAGRLVAASGASRFWAVGAYATEMIDAAGRAGMPPDGTGISDSHESMASNILGAVREGDVVLLKGSRSAEMEKVVEILASQWSSK